MLVTLQTLNRGAIRVLLMLSFLSVLVPAQALTGPGTEKLRFFGGEILAKLTWIAQPSSTRVASLKIEIQDSHQQAYDVDPTVVGLGLFMDEMPEMGVEQQNVVAMSDASGSSIPGVFMVSDLQFSMAGKWSVRLTLPNPKNSAQTEMQQFSLRVQ